MPPTVPRHRAKSPSRNGALTRFLPRGDPYLDLDRPGLCSRGSIVNPMHFSVSVFHSWGKAANTSSRGEARTPFRSGAPGERVGCPSSPHAHPTNAPPCVAFPPPALEALASNPGQKRKASDPGAHDELPRGACHGPCGPPVPRRPARKRLVRCNADAFLERPGSPPNVEPRHLLTLDTNPRTLDRCEGQWERHASV